MKLKKTAVIFLLLAVLLAAAGMLMTKNQENSETVQTEEPLPVVTDISASKLQALLISDGDRQTVIYNDKNGLIIDGVSDMSAYSRSGLINLAYSVIHMTAEKKLSAENAGELVPEESAVLVCIFTDTDTIRLYLGRECPVAEGSYLKNEQGEVFLIPAETAELIRKPVEDYRNLNMFPALSSDNLSSLQALRITNGSESYTLRQVSGDTVSTFYAITEPVEILPDWENVYKEIIDPLFSLVPDRFVSDNADMADYGFRNPDYILELLIDGEVYACGFIRSEGDRYYCANMNTHLVSEISAEKIAFLAKSYMELIGGSIYSLSAADASSVSAKYEDGSTEIEITGFSETLCASAGERELSKRETTELFSRITSVPAVSQLTGEEELSDSVMLTMTFAKRDGTTDILEFRPVNDRQCAVFINGKADFTTYTTIVRDLISAFRNL